MRNANLEVTYALVVAFPGRMSAHLSDDALQRLHNFNISAPTIFLMQHATPN